ncbi:ricin-type beta-trefoil lectin domain protein [Streptomyces dubilierae]|uniref:Ricin-type beta-trefoil lectin domain protein n=1 Tax=Streptomyces dubilierae TaxID=3075533 RepID=A0ABU2P576_9ACTN|nr:ricin-type beta-trefoil lectin domain protein [Streptomyces sp. DSM 41921]MDT0386219.1 ricin-type beta-trefoil lectin domain protein [Streptomyces sp. DSM 41921]
MTRSAQQPSASPEAGTESAAEGGPAPAAKTAVASQAPVPGSGSGDESAPPATTGKAAAGAPATAVVSATRPSSRPTGADGGEGTEAPEAAPSGTAASAAADSETGASPAPRSTGEADPGAAAAAKSRLPALVRTMTETAIDRPRQQAAPVGRPGKAVLAGAAVAGALLVSVPFLVLGGNDDESRKASAGAGTVLGDDGQEAPGQFVVSSPDSSPSATARESAGTPRTTTPDTPASPSSGDKSEDEPKKDTAAKEQPKAPAKGRQDARGGGGTSGGGNDRPAAAGSGVTFSSPVSLRSHLSGRCVDVPDGDFSDGKQLWVWDCNNSPAQKWQFASDGTMRIGGKCLDVAGANYGDGTPIQIAWCNGNAAQKFTLNASHDLVNTVVGKCVDIKDNNRGNGAVLQLWTCAGTDNQKWSV